MADLEGIEQLKALYIELLRGSFSKLEGFLDKDFVVRSPASLPYGGKKHGAVGLAAMMSGFIERGPIPNSASQTIQAMTI